MEQKNIPLIISAIACALLLGSLDIHRAYADISITIVTPINSVYGTLSATSDCTEIAKGGTIIWVACNNVLYAIASTTNTIIANASVTVSVADRFLASVVGSNLFHMSNTGNTVNKYTYSANTITLSGTYSPVGCSFGDTMQYDEQGYIWLVCDAEDKILKFNPNTLTTVMFSQDLTDAVGIDCDAPAHISYSNPTINIGVLRCGGTSLAMETFSYSGNTVTLLDSEAGSGSNGVFIHEQVISGGTTFRQIVAFSSIASELWTFTSGGITTLSQSIAQTTDACASQYANSAEHFIVCIDDSGTNTAILGFKSNSTGLYQLINTIASGYDNSEGINIDVSESSVSSWYVSSNLNNQRFIKITGFIESDDTTPTPPSDGGGEPNIVGGVNCDLPQNQGILLCVEQTDGTIFPTGSNATDVTNDLGCVFTVIACTDGEPDNPDIKTNGMGLAITLVMLLISVALLTVATRGQLTQVHPIAWGVVFTGIVGISYMFQFIELQWFLLTVFFAIAFIAMKITPSISGIFDGGSSA